MTKSSKFPISLATITTAIVMFSVFSSIPSVHAPPNLIVWTSKSSIPAAVGQAGVVGGLDGRIYVAGGFSGGSPFTTFRAYDPRYDNWTSLASLPTPTRGPGAAVDNNGLIYIMSGYSGAGDVSNNQVYNSTSNTWSAGTAVPTPVWLPGATTGVDGRIYLAGGETSSGSASSILQIYNPQTKLWSTGASMSTTRKQFQLVSAANGLIYAMGGYNSLAIATVEAYNITSNTWTSEASLPVPVMSYAAAPGPDGLIYVFGGSTSYSNDNSPYYNTVYSYDPSTNTWYTNSQNLPTARREALAAISNYNSRVYVVGGGNGAYLTTNEEATISLGTGHNTTTIVSCHPSSIVANNVTSCTATVTDTSANATSPTGTVSFSSTGTGIFSGTCTLVSGTGANATCATSVSYRPTAVGTGSHVIRGTYLGDSTHNPSVSNGPQSSTIIVTARTTSTVVSCVPSSVTVGSGSTCTTTLTDTTSAGTSATPTGTVSFTRSGTATGSFSSASCSLSSGSCSTTFTPSSAGNATITGNYNGDGMHSTSNGISNPVNSTFRTTSIAILCSPMSTVVNNSTRCTITVTDTYPAPAVTPIGTITLSTTGTGSFTTCTLSGSGFVATCSTTYSPTVIGTGLHVLTAHYGGDSRHSASNPDAYATINVTPRTVATAVSCTWPVPIGSTTNCTVTITDTSPGTFSTPTGNITLTGGTGSFTGTCTLSGTGLYATCSQTYSPNGTVSRTDTITASYPGDTRHASGSGSFLLQVANTNQPPVAIISSVSPNPAQTGDSIIFVGSGTDSDGTIVAFSWRSSISGTISASASFQTNLPAGTHTVYLKVEDNNGAWSPEVSVDVAVTSSPPLGNGLQPQGWPTYYWAILLIAVAGVGVISYGVGRKGKKQSTPNSPTITPTRTLPPPAPPTASTPTPSPPVASTPTSPSQVVNEPQPAEPTRVATQPEQTSSTTSTTTPPAPQPTVQDPASPKDS